MVQVIKGTLYSCDCGYVTFSKDCASKHSKTRRCLHLTMTKEETSFVREEDYNKKGADINIVGDNNNADKSTHITNINLVIPKESLIGSMFNALTNPDCVLEIKNAQPEQIPAILFKFSRGVSAEETMVKYDTSKGSVIHKDPNTGKDVSKDLKKYRNEYLLEGSDIFNVHQIQYMPDVIKEEMTDMTEPVYKTGKKKDDPINAAQVIKICASGDHAMYKMPYETKEFYSKVAKNVDTQIKITGDT